MATACLIISWNRPYPDHVKQGYGVLLGQGLELINKWQKEGWFEDRDLIGLTPHGGTVNGFILMKGERAKLDELRRTDEFEAFVMRLGLHLDQLAIVPGVTEEGIKNVMKRNPELI